MTFPLKENLIYFEQLAKRSERIYPDACDSGVKYENRNEALNGPREQLQELMKFYGFHSYSWGGGYGTAWTGGKTTQVCIPVERDDEDGLELYGCCILEVSFNRDERSQKRPLYWLSINVRHERMSPKSAKEKFGCKVLGRE